MNKIRFLFLLGFIVSIGLSRSYGQEKKLYEKDGQKFKIHIVEKGNTFYGISRQHSISVEDLKKQNPKLGNKLSIGDTLWIAFDEVKNNYGNNKPTDNSNYLTYIVQEKNTLYSIAKEYNVEIKDIVLANPQLQEGLKVGMELRIPLKQLRNDDKKALNDPYALLNYETHVVKPKETLYSLSTQYNVEIDSILLLNQGLPEGLKIGQEIVLPIRKKAKPIETPRYLQFDSSKIKQEYKIALLLPFYLAKIQAPSDTSDFSFLENQELMFKHASYGIEFYEGLVLALDSMRKNGLSAKLFVYDAANDTAKIRSILSKPEMKTMDLIIGPLFFSEFMIAADFAKKNRINIVSPVKQSNKILLGNDYVSKVVSSNPILIKSLATLIADSLSHENVIVVYSDNVKERINLEQFNEAYTTAKQKTKDSLSKKPVIVEWKDNSSFTTLKSRLIPDSTGKKKNHIVVLSDNQAMVTQLLTSLYNIYTQYEINVFGLEDWEEYSNLDIDYLHKLNVHLVLPEFVDQNNTKVIYFNRKFTDTYNSLPGKFAYLGYDVGIYYLSLLNRYGENIRSMYDQHSFQVLGRDFNFMKTGIESGYENHSYNLVKYQDYQLRKVK